MTRFEDFYGSFLAQPVLLWCAAIVGLSIVALRRSTSRSVRVFGLLFGAVSLLDAWLTADSVAGIGSLGTMSPDLGVAVGIAFVIVGDFRVFLFLACATPDGEITLDRKKTARAFLWSFVVPVASTVVRSFLPPDAPWRGRVTFLFYEVAFTAVMLGFRLFSRSATLGWARRVVGYVLVYYALWALADAVILVLHLDAGYLLRVVPNVLYYGGFLAAVSLFAPARTSEGSRAV